MQLALNAFGLYFVFALFHSMTAHEIFKDCLGKIAGKYFVEHFWRLIYCLASYFLLYEAFGSYVASFETYELLVQYPSWFWNILAIVHLGGLIINYWAYIQLDYFEFWGLKQAWRGIINWRSTAWRPMALAGVNRLEVRGIYHFCRHPALAGGFLFMISLPPYQTYLYFNVFYLIYMLFGAVYEERRLIAHFGDDYLNYRKEVGAFWPHPSQIGRWISSLYRWLQPAT